MGPWPLPALLVWALAWGLCLVLASVRAPAWVVWLLPAAWGALLSLWPRIAATTWRRWFVALGFPLSALAMGQGQGLPPWAWLAPLALLLLVYPLNAWRDAPVFPTPAGALSALAHRAALPPGAQVLDAGCGMGDGLIELRRAYPQAVVHGVEWSWLWRLVSAARCPWARVRRGDMWACDWSSFDLVYLFQRPESMPRAVDKARRELKPGAWLVSLEFPATDGQGRALKPHARLEAGGGRAVWVYRQPL